MSRLFVDSIRCGFTSGSAVLGPVGGQPVAEAAILNLTDRTVTYCCAAELFDRLVFYEAPVSVIDGLADPARQIPEFRMALAGYETARYRDANELFEDLTEGYIFSREDEMKRRFLYFCLHADTDELGCLMRENAGCCLEDYVIPVSDAEQLYLDDRDEREIWEEEEDDGIF